jgi:O-antigen chain-terminating methyltransferase
VSAPTSGPIIDVDRLVADLQERVAARTAAGGYDESLLAAPFELLTGTPVGTIVLRPEAAYSSKPVVGPLITWMKRGLIRSLFHFLNDAVSQANVALAAGRTAVERETGAREALEAQLQGTTRELDEARDRIHALEAEIERQRAIVARLDLLEIEPRLSRLERTGRAERVDAASIRPVDPELVALAAHLVEPEAPERLDAYAAQIAAGPVLDLAPGDGELLARCAAADIPARGVDVSETIVAACRDRGLDAELGDPLALLGATEPGSLGGIAALGLCDRLGLGGVTTLADLAATRLRPGGTLVIEIANPLTVAGRARRLRDPTVAPPIHPDTLAWTLRLAGLDAVETRYLGAFAGDETLPLEDPPRDEMGERYNAIARRLNRALVGEPLVAIFARRPGTA